MKQLLIVFLSVFFLVAGTGPVLAGDKDTKPAVADTGGVKAPAKAEKGATLTKEQQAQVKAWQDRITYLNQAEEKALNDIVNGRIERAQIQQAFKAMTAPKKDDKKK